MDDNNAILLIIVLVLLFYFMSNGKKNPLTSKSKPTRYYNRGGQPTAPGAVQTSYDIDGDGISDYNEYVTYNSLEPSVFNSHRKFIDEVHHRTTGASVETVRTDDNDINPWVGLRRPNYFSISAESDARTTHSEFPEQMPNPALNCYTANAGVTSSNLYYPLS